MNRDLDMLDNNEFGIFFSKFKNVYGQKMFKKLKLLWHIKQSQSKIGKEQ